MSAKISDIGTKDEFATYLSDACSVLTSVTSSPAEFVRALDDVSEYGALVCEEELPERYKQLLEQSPTLSQTIFTGAPRNFTEDCATALSRFKRRLRARSLLQEGIDYRNDEDKGQARKSFLAAETADAEGPFADIARAYRLIDGRDFVGAIQLLEQTSAEWQMCYEAQLHLGQIYKQWAKLAAYWESNEQEESADTLTSEEARKRYMPRAVVALERACLLNPDSAYSFSVRAECKLQLLTPEAAQRDEGIVESIKSDIDRALALKPNFGHALRQRADLLYRMRDRDGALDAYDAVLESPSTSQLLRFFTLRQKANALLAHPPNPKKAEVAYRDALDIRPDDALTFIGLARICFNNPKRIDEGLEFCEKALQSQHTNTDALFWKARLLKKQGSNTDEAITLFRRLLPSPKTARWRKAICTDLAELLSVKGELIEAYSLLDGIRELLENDRNAKALGARLYGQLPDVVVALVNRLEPKIQESGELSDSEEHELMLATTLPVRESARAKLLAAKFRMSQRRSADVLNLLQNLPPTFQRATVSELRRQAYKSLESFAGAPDQPRAQGARITFVRQQPVGTQIYELALLEEFYSDIVTREHLPIGDVVTQAERDGKPIGGLQPIFLKAATGVGKTVAAPLYIYLQLIRRIANVRRWREIRDAQVIVVEPRIAIAENEAIHLNDLFLEFLKRRGHTTAGSAGIFGSVTSATGRQNGNAPVVFVTSGVFESMAQNIGNQRLGLNAELHRVVIDEAHVTLPANPGVEVAVALCRRANVVVDYMSATVDDAGLNRMLGVEIVDATTGYVRYPIEYRPTGEALEACLVPLVDEYLIRRRNISKELQDHDTQEKPEDRAIGMLVVVNSHQAENSDTLRYARLLEEYRDATPSAQNLEIKRLASPVLRNPVLRHQFEGWKQSLDGRVAAGEAPRYIIIATNVVEMGVTIPSLDFVVSMDTEFVTEEGLGGSILRKVPISVSALTQRAGRSGRRRPGMCFLTREENEPDAEGRLLSVLDGASLRKALNQPEQLHPSLVNGNLERLALLSFKEGEQAAERWSLLEDIPSFQAGGAEFVARLEEARNRLVAIGLADGRVLTDVGRSVVELVKCGDLQFAQLFATGHEDRLKLPLAIIVGAGETSLGDVVHPHRMLNESTADSSGLGRRRGARLSLEESVSTVQGPDGELFSLDVETEEVTNLLAEDGVEALAELIDEGMNPIHASIVARLLGRGFDVVEWQETIGQEPTDPDVHAEWERAAERARQRLHFRRTITLLDSESDLLSIYLVAQAVLKDYAGVFASKGVASYVREKLVEQCEHDLRVAELRPREVKAFIIRALELAEDLRLLRNRSLGGASESRFGRGTKMPQAAVDAAVEVAVLSQNIEAMYPIPPSLVTPSMRAITWRILDAPAERPDHSKLSGYLNDEIGVLDERFESRKLDSWLNTVLLPAEQQARAHLRRLEEIPSPISLPILTVSLRASLLAHFRRPPFYGDELVLRQNGYGNYEARRIRGNDPQMIELSVGRTGVKLKGEYVRVVGRLRPGSRKVANLENGQPPIDEPILVVTHVTVIENELDRARATKRMSELGLA